MLNDNFSSIKIAEKKLIGFTERNSMGVNGGCWGNLSIFVVNYNTKNYKNKGSKFNIYN